MTKEIDSGGGYLGVQLDGLVGSPGGLPFSYLLAGWLSAAPTATAAAAADLMGQQPWEQAPSLVFPTAVLALFVADAVAAQGGTAEAPIRAMAVFAPAVGVCSTLSGWVNQVLDFLFDSLKVDADTDSFLGWLGTIWNAAVDLAKAAISGLIETLTAPIVALITDALVVIGTLSMIASLLRPWSLEVSASSSQTRFAVGGEPDISEQFTASVDTNIDFDWPAELVDCAGVAGLDLPDPSSATDSTVDWKVAGLPPLGAVANTESRIDANNMARLDWVTGREESDKGEPLSGRASVSVTVTSIQIEELKAMLEGLIAGQIPVPPFGDIVAELFAQLTAPIFDALAELVRVNGAGSATVFYHGEEEEETTQPASGLDPCVTGTWVSTPWSLPGPAGLTGTGGDGAVVRIDANGSAEWDFGAMEPVVVVDEQIDVTTEMYSRGTATGQVSASGGTWEVTSDTSRMEGYSIDNIIGRFPLEGGPGLFVMLLDGGYTCSGNTLTFTTIDPVENTPVTIGMQRR
jgi:hypothetical protein